MESDDVDADGSPGWTSCSQTSRKMPSEIPRALGVHHQGLPIFVLSCLCLFPRMTFGFSTAVTVALWHWASSLKFVHWLRRETSSDLLLYRKYQSMQVQT